MTDRELTIEDLPPSDPRRIGVEVERYVENYMVEFDEGPYEPTEHERFLLLDCCMGLIYQLEEIGALVPPASSSEYEW